MSWKCNVCGGQVKLVASRTESKTYTLDKEGNEKTCVEKTVGDIEGRNYSCKKCGAFYDDEIKLKDIAKWED